MKKIWFYTLLLLTLGLTACQDTDKLEADLNSLGDRVAALESKVEMLNGNIKALNILCQDGMIISKVEHNATDGVYSITLSDGTTLKLMEKISGFGIAPVVSIDADGNWQVSYDNGDTFQPILKGDAPVNAVGKDGVTPKFRVGEGDFWEVSIDGGVTYAQVKDVNNQPVKAVYDPQTNPNQQFTSVMKTEDYLEVKLSGGETVRVPIVADFFCYFDAAITGEQKINPGETKTYNVHIKGVENTVITTPMGWKATLAAPTNDVAVLTVVAPAAAAPTSRAMADNTRDISILALKGTFATLTKIQVNPIEVGGGAVTPPTPSGALITPLSASTTIVGLWNIDPYKETSQLEDFWYHKSNKKDQTTAYTDGIVTLVDETIGGTATKALQLQYIQAYNSATPPAATTNSFYISTMGYYKKGVNFATTKQYKLSFKVKKTAGAETAGNKVLVAMVFPDVSTGKFVAFTVYNESGDPTTALYSKPLDAIGAWSDVSVIFDLRYKASVGSITTTNPKLETVAIEAQDLDLRFYTQQINTTFCIADVKMEEYVP